MKDAVHTPRAQTRISSGRRRAQGGRTAAVGSRLGTGKATRQVNAAGGSKRVKNPLHLLLRWRLPREAFWLPMYSIKFKMIKNQEISRKCIVTQ